MIRSLLDRVAARVLAPEGVDFTTPPGEPAVVPAGSVSWDVYGNPVTLYIGGIAAVLLELGEPRVRHGVWDHSSFKRDPGRRLRRTGMAAMVTVYGARSVFEATAARVNRMHAQIRGTTPEGIRYAADDPELLLWVQATATWAFMEAYHRYARPVSPVDRDRYFAESRAGAALYGVEAPPASGAELDALFAAMAPRLGPSDPAQVPVGPSGRAADAAPAASHPAARDPGGRGPGAGRSPAADRAGRLACAAVARAPPAPGACPHCRAYPAALQPPLLGRAAREAGRGERALFPARAFRSSLDVAPFTWGTGRRALVGKV